MALGLIAVLMIVIVFFKAKRSEQFRIKTEKIAVRLPDANCESGIDSDADEEEEIFDKKSAMSERKKRVKGFTPSDEPNKFVEIYNEIRTRENEKKPAYALNYKMNELQKARTAVSRNLFQKKAAALPWIERGPGNVSGRTRGLIVDPDDPGHRTWFAGSVGGGIWKTANAGQTWVNKTTELPNLATTVLAMAESNHDIIYAGTGEGFFNVDAVNGNGIFKSTDRGETWLQLPSTADNPDFQNVNRIVVDPQNADIVLACANGGFYLPSGIRSSGIYKSMDGGESWSRVYLSNGARVQQLAANPENFNTLYATVNGTGVLKSTDGGDTWQLSSQGIGTSGRIELAVAPTDTSRIYISVENGLNSDFYVSENGGQLWYPVNDISGTNPAWLGSQGWYDNTIAVHPFNEDIIFVGGINIWKIEMQPDADTSSGVTGVDQQGTNSFLSFVSWGGSYAGGGIGTGEEFLGAYDVAASDYVSVEIRFGPGQSQKAFRFTLDEATGNYIYQDFVEVPFEVWDIKNNIQLNASFRDWANDGSFDLGSPSTPIPREYLFVNATPYDPANPDTSYQKTNGFARKNIYAMWPVLAAGAVWNPTSLPESVLRIRYSNQIITKTRTTTPVTDGYGQYGAPYVHVDHHNLIMVPVDQAADQFWIINGNDGGVAYSMNGGNSWTSPLAGYNTTQFYGADKKPGANEYIGGTQDNGTWQSAAGDDAGATSVYRRVIGGDGFEVSWNYRDGNKILGSSQYNSIWKSLDGGNSWAPARNGLQNLGASGGGPFITKLAKTNSDPDLVFAVGSSGVWRTDTFGSRWTLSPITSGWGFSSSFTEIKVSLANPQIVWTGAYMGTAGRVFVSVDGGLTFNPTNNFTDVPMGRISGLATHPLEDSTTYALFSFAHAPKILRTRDLGQTWEDISGFEQNSKSATGFPDVATYCLLVMPYNPDIMWAGTEIGIFESVDGGQSWAYADNSLPAVAVWDLTIVDDQVVAATHGRGIWSVVLPELAEYKPPVVTLSPRLNQSAQQPTGNLVIDASLRSVYDSTLVMIDNSRYLTIFSDTAKDTLLTLAFPVSDPSTINVYLTSYKNGMEYKSSAQKVNLFPLSEPQAWYANNFNEPSSDFVGTGFEISTPAGFSNPSINSAHPYPDNTDNTYQLMVPIEVAPDNATFTYDDIAVVEPGEPGSVYGDALFWDYVIAEGTSDGVNWIPLLAGYDARYDAAWLNAYNGGAINQSLYRKHSINLLDKFSAGDKILLRFRLFADANTHGWGWSIDNVRVQAPATGIARPASLPQTYSLEQNYPNPFNPSTNIRFSIPRVSNVTLKVYDGLGREVATLVNKRMKPGHYDIIWNAEAMASGVYFYRIQAGSFIQARKLLLLK